MAQQTRLNATEHMFEQLKHLEPPIVQTLQSLVDHLIGTPMASSQSPIRDLQAQVARLEAQLEECQTDMFSQRTCIKTLVERNQEKEHENEHLRTLVRVMDWQKLVAKEKELAISQARIQDLTKQLLRMENENTQVAPLKSRVHLLEFQLWEKETNIDSLKVKIEGLEKRLDSQPQVDGEMWQFQGDSGEWISFTDKSSKWLMNKFREGHQTCQMCIDGRTYDIDFRGGWQKNQRTEKERKIRCFFDLPPHWNMGDEDALHLLNSTGTNFRHSMEKLTDANMVLRLEQVLNGSRPRHDGTLCHCSHGSSNFVVLEAYQIKNLHLWRRYQRFVRSICDKHRQHGVSPENISPPLGEALTEFAVETNVDLAGNQRLLLHGTCSYEIANAIATEGFDNRVAEDRGLYGAGTYFSAQMCKSAQYASEHRHQKASFEMPGTILIARVAIGDPFYARGPCEWTYRPPEKNGVLADSIIARPGIPNDRPGGVQSHMEVVTFAPEQVYPEFIVRFMER